jgi:hypothetical protein
LVLIFVVELVNSIEPGRVKMISARRFAERRCTSFAIPRASPVNSITRQTPSATPAMLTSARTGRWRIFAATRLSMSLDRSGQRPASAAPKRKRLPALDPRGCRRESFLLLDRN